MWLGSADGVLATLRVNCGESPLWGGDGDDEKGLGWKGPFLGALPHLELDCPALLSVAGPGG